MNNNPTAFPTPTALIDRYAQWGGSDRRFPIETTGGMTLRDWFAGQALCQAIGIVNADDSLANKELKKISAALAYGIADAMLAARKEA